MSISIKIKKKGLLIYVIDENNKILLLANKKQNMRHTANIH